MSLAADTSVWSSCTARSSACSSARGSRLPDRTGTCWCSAPPSVAHRPPRTYWPAPTLPGPPSSVCLQRSIFSSLFLFQLEILLFSCCACFDNTRSLLNVLDFPIHCYVFTPWEAALVTMLRKQTKLTSRFSTSVFVRRHQSDLQYGVRSRRMFVHVGGSCGTVLFAQLKYLQRSCKCDFISESWYRWFPPNTFRQHNLLEKKVFLFILCRIVCSPQKGLSLPQYENFWLLCFVRAQLRTLLTSCTVCT